MARSSRGGIRSVGIFAVIAISLGVTAILIAGGNHFSVAASPLSGPGDLLIAGGDAGAMLFGAVPAASFIKSSNSAQIFDPTTGTFTAVSELAQDRESAVAVALPNGKVLVAGGASCAANGNSGANCQSLASAELYDPASATFSSAGTGSMTAARFGATATLISGCSCALDGDVLIAGGNSGSFTLTQSGFTFQAPNKSAELYDYRSNTFTAITAMMVSAREGHAAALIPNSGGKILLAGGDDQGFFQHSIASAEVFDPSAQTFTATAGAMNAAREIANAIALDPASVSGPLAGDILISGGLSATANLNGSSLSSAELFDPASGGSFHAVSGAMGSARTEHSAILFPAGSALGGKVLLAGGVNVSGAGAGIAGMSADSTNTADIYDPGSGATGSLTATTGTMHESRGGHAAARLTSGTSAGQVIVAGGEHCVAAACVVVFLFRCHHPCGACGIVRSQRAVVDCADLRDGAASQLPGGWRRHARRSGRSRLRNRDFQHRGDAELDRDADDCRLSGAGSVGGFAKASRFSRRGGCREQRRAEPALQGDRVQSEEHEAESDRPAYRHDGFAG